MTGTHQPAWLALALVVAGACLVAADGDTLVRELTPDTLQSTLDSAQVVLVFFHSPGCQRCEELLVTLGTVAERLHTEAPDVVVGQVSSPDLAGLDHAVTIFRDGADFPLAGEFTVDSVVSEVVSYASPDWTSPKTNAVVALTSSTFADAVANEELMLVEFYAPWCGHCKHLEPEYESAAQRLLLATPPITLAKVDATEERELAQQFDVKGYPTLFVMRHGKHFPYHGPRDAAGIEDYMLALREPAYKTLSRPVDKFAGLEQLALVAFFREGELESPLGKAFADACDFMREEMLCAVVDREDLRAPTKHPFGSVVLYQPFKYISKHEPADIPFEGEATGDSVVDFVHAHRTTLVPHVTQETISELESPYLVALFDVNWSREFRDETAYWRAKLVKVAKQVPSLRFAIADRTEFSHLVADLGLTQSDNELAVGIFSVSGKAFRYKGEPSEEGIREFAEAFLGGKLKPYLKSAKPPKSNKGPVKVVVGKTFDKHVTNSGKHVLLEFYAPWCGHCKKLEPVYQQLAQDLASHKDLVIAKLDATENGYPDAFEVTGFPTLYFVPSNDKDHPVKFEGSDRQLDTLKDFVLTEMANAAPHAKSEL